MIPLKAREVMELARRHDLWWTVEIGESRLAPWAARVSHAA
jgi:hypothetical protein